MTILAIDTSCDETSVAVTCDRQVLSSVVSSQIRYHRKFGGVVPFLAGRLHTERISRVTELALQRAGLTWSEIDVLAVTAGPGLAPALEAGISYAKTLSAEHNLPLYAVHHMLGHIASCWAHGSRVLPAPSLPAIAVLVSGGHTEIDHISEDGIVQILGCTRDDALGEAYDKVARLLGLGYPGGVLLARLAEEGDASQYPLPIAMERSGDLDVSYSGIKTAVRYLVEELGTLSAVQTRDIAASFVHAAHETIARKVLKALDQHPVESIVLAGGVAANTALRARLRQDARAQHLPLVTPFRKQLCTDNAAMIGVAAWWGIERGQKPVILETLEREPGIRFPKMGSSEVVLPAHALLGKSAKIQ
jgi:N6-L-threonylcarbamoyladenine synthase